MSKFNVNFIIDGKSLEPLMHLLQPYDVRDLSLKLVDGTAVKARAGDMSAPDLVLRLMDKTPRRISYFKDAVLGAGFNNSTVYYAIDTLLERKLITRKVVDGKPHFVRTK